MHLAQWLDYVGDDPSMARFIRQYWCAENPFHWPDVSPSRAHRKAGEL